MFHLPNIVRVIKSRKPRHVTRMEDGRRAFKIFMGKPTGKRLLGRPRHRGEDNEEFEFFLALDRDYWDNLKPLSSSASVRTQLLLAWQI